MVYILSSQLRITLTCRGYCSPEYALHGHISTALDIYSFGILMLEVVCGRKSIDLSKPEEEMYIRDWVCTNYSSYLIMPLILCLWEFQCYMLDAHVCLSFFLNLILNYVFEFNSKNYPLVAHVFLIKIYT